jgi:plastocyanin
MNISYHPVMPCPRISIGFLLALGVSACGGGSGSTAPTPPPSEVTINVTATGFKPPEVTIAVGGRVTFDNIDDRLHSIASNPLTTHTDCPAINDVGVLVPGQSKETGALTVAKTCPYHDTFSEGAQQILMGTIIVK